MSYLLNMHTIFFNQPLKSSMSREKNLLKRTVTNCTAFIFVNVQLFFALNDCSYAYRNRIITNSNGTRYFIDFVKTEMTARTWRRHINLDNKSERLSLKNRVVRYKWENLKKKKTRQQPFFTVKIFIFVGMHDNGFPKRNDIFMGTCFCGFQCYLHMYVCFLDTSVRAPRTPWKLVIHKI